MGNPGTVEDGITIAKNTLKDRRRKFVRTEVKHIRTMQVVWSSALALRPGGVR